MGMAEKRFKLDSEIGFIDSKRCGWNAMTSFEVVVELNKLYEENKQLKKKLDFFNELNKPYGDLIKENQRLKCINKQLEERLGRSLALDMEECE